MRYGREKFRRAVESLATSPHAIRERVRDAWISQLGYIDPQRNLPARLREDFNEQRLKMTSSPPNGEEGLFAAAAMAMSVDEAIEAAQWIVAFNHQLPDDA